MKPRNLLLLLSLILLIGSLASLASASEFLESLQPDQKVNGFTIKAVYENSAGKLMGARFVSDKYGFVLDLMQIQSVPQGFMWVKSAPESDRGEPHACEHLLLGKGTAGRFVATLEDMALGQSTAYTSQIYTAYPFNTTAGSDAFWELFEAKLDAMANPNFTDEEIRREVCKVGVVENTETGELELEEKGTCYTEMISSYEKYYYPLWNNISEMQYGIDHVMTNSAGGNPDSMRTMTAEDMWEFQKSAYRMGNMGIIMSVPDQIDLREALTRTDGILNRVQSDPEPNSPGTIGNPDIAPPVMDETSGKIMIDYFPHDNPEEPGHILMGYPPHLELDNFSGFMLDLFLETFASGPGTNLYDLFMNSETRKMDFGGNSAWGYHSSDPGHPVFFGLSSVANANVTEAKMDSARAFIMAEIEKINGFENSSEALDQFNERAKARLIQTFKQADQFLNSPPGFGFRSNPGAAWYSIMEFLEGESTFRKSLVFANHIDKANQLLETDQNFWTDFINKWKLLEVRPYVSGVQPSAEMIVVATEAKAARLDGYVEQFKKQYGTDDAQAAMAAYQADYDKNTADLEAIAAKDELPGFVDNPPLSLDESLKYEQFTIGPQLPMTASTFDNMTTGTIGLAMRLDVLPEEDLVYVPFLVDVLGEIGVVKDGEVIEYNVMDDRLRREVLNLNAYFSTNMPTDRIELVLRGAGSNDDELLTVLDWMEAMLYTPYLDEANLTRIRDVIDQSLVSLRGTMNAPEERWVRDPSTAYRYQHNPLFLSTSSFLTRIFAYERLKWLFTSAGDDNDRVALETFFGEVALFGKDKNKEELETFLAVVNDPSLATDDLQKTLADESRSEAMREIATELLKSLKSALPGIPAVNVTEDWAYMCERFKSDLLTDPVLALAEVKDALKLITRADNARLFMISSTDTRASVLPRLDAFVSKLDASTNSIRHHYGNTRHILARAKSREPEIEKPVYAGLVYEGTRNGVLMFNASRTEPYETSEDAILDHLTGKMYGGGGGHGLFMRTWGAGLAYSNGYSISDRSGRTSYYAERCPDVSETMRFVVGVLKDSEADPRLVEYSIAQMFSGSRAASRYESRGESMASDLADGYPPDRVSAFREAVLAARDRDDLFEQMRTRMPNVYGQVLIGYGPELSESEDGHFFLIGPETQFESLTKYIASVEKPVEIIRLYPRDFWLTN